MKKIYLLVGLSLILNAYDVFHGVKMLSTFKPTNDYVIDRQDKKTITYKRKLQNDYFNFEKITIDKSNNKIIDIAFTKTKVFDLSGEGNKLLLKLKNKYGDFKCYPLTVQFFGRIGDECVSLKPYHNNTIYLRAVTFNGNQLIVEYKNKKMFDINKKDNPDDL